MKHLSLFFSESKPLAQLVGLCLLFFFGFTMASVVQMLWLPGQGEGADAVRISLAQQGVSQLLTFLLPSILFALFFSGEPFRFLQIDLHGRKWLMALIAIVVFILLMPTIDWLTVWNEGWNLGSAEAPMRGMSERSLRLTQRLLSLDTVGDLFLQLLVVALLPAVCEELFFRCCLQQVFQRCFSSLHVAVVASALVFSLAHADLYGLVPRFVLGLLLGYTFALSGSLLVNVGVHFVNNAIVVLLYFFYHRHILLADPSAPLSFPPATTAACGVAALVLFLFYFTKILLPNSLKH